MNLLKRTSMTMVCFLFSLIAANILLQDDFMPFLIWWIVIGILGVVFIPLSSKLFSNFNDRGYLFSKVIGIAVTGYGLWLLSSFHILKFTEMSCTLVVILSLIIIIAILWLKNHRSFHNMVGMNYTSDTLRIVIAEEVLFFIILLVWTYIRGFKPEASGTEKFMDYGFMTTMMRSEYMPPQDLWFAGESINYYYVGQYFATFLTKLARIRVNEGYNLMLMTLASFGFVLPFSLVYNLIHNYGRDIKKRLSKIAIFGGGIAGAAVSLAGNMHFVLYYFIVPKIRTILELEGDYDSYWFPDSTRYIGYNPDSPDKTIHEYPSYSYILGDLHAHVLNTIFVFTLLAILLSYMLKMKNRHTIGKENLKTIVKEHLLQVDIILIGCFIGLFHTTNFWDFPIYYVVAGAIILFTNIKYCGSGRDVGIITGLQGIFILVLARVIALPFNYKFDTISSQIFLTDKRTPIYQLVILWGLPICLVITFLVYLVKKVFDEKSQIVNRESISTENVIVTMIKKININDLFILTIGLCAIGLVLVPEIVYVKDIYSGDYKRANTMFKLTYQAFIMFGICFGYIIVKYLAFNKKGTYRLVGYISLFLVLCTVWYSKVAVNAWYGDLTKVNNYKGLDSTAYMEITMYDDYMAVEWLNNNIEGLPVIVEAYGSSYSDYQRISVATGLPTVVGWHVHEWLWRGDESLVTAREEDVDILYTSDDMDEVRRIIDIYNIEYIYIGELEDEKYENLNKELLLQLGETVFYSDVQEETYIIKVSN